MAWPMMPLLGILTCELLHSYYMAMLMTWLYSAEIRELKRYIVLAAVGELCANCTFWWRSYSILFSCFVLWLLPHYRSGIQSFLGGQPVILDILFIFPQQILCPCCPCPSPVTIFLELTGSCQCFPLSLCQNGDLSKALGVSQSCSSTLFTISRT